MTTYDDLTQLLRELEGGTGRDCVEDPWGTALEAWFESVGRMNVRGLFIPSSWQYSPGLGGGIDPDSIWYESCEDATDDALVKFATVLSRYLSKLRLAGEDY